MRITLSASSRVSGSPMSVGRFGNALPNFRRKRFHPLMDDQILVSEPEIIHADVEDGHVFLIHTVLMSDTDELLEKVWALVGAKAPIEDRTEDYDYFLFRKARIRRWKL